MSEEKAGREGESGKVGERETHNTIQSGSYIRYHAICTGWKLHKAKQHDVTREVVGFSSVTERNGSEHFDFISEIIVLADHI